MNTPKNFTVHKKVLLTLLGEVLTVIQDEDSNSVITALNYLHLLDMVTDIPLMLYVPFFLNIFVWDNLARQKAKFISLLSKNDGSWAYSFLLEIEALHALQNPLNTLIV